MLARLEGSIIAAFFSTIAPSSCISYPVSFEIFMSCDFLFVGYRECFNLGMKVSDRHSYMIEFVVWQ